MSNEQTTFRIKAADGKSNIEVPFQINMYQKAQAAGMSLTQYLSQQYGSQTDERTYGPVISQMMGDSGMYLGTDLQLGLRSPTLAQIASEGISMSSIVRNDGSERNTPAGRLLFPEILMRTMEATLRDDNGDVIRFWTDMIAVTETINGPNFDQPVVNIPTSVGRSAPIGQLARPNRMLTLTTANVARKIATRAIGLQISDEAKAATTLQLVNIILAAQAREERIGMVYEDIGAIVNGDSDRGESSLSSLGRVVAASSFDAAATTPAAFSHQAWLKYLRRDYRKMRITHIMADLATAMAIEKRTGKPTRDTVITKEGSNFSTDMNVDNLSIQAPSVFLLDDGIIAAGLMVGLDKNVALRRVINISAQYSAIEQFALLKGSAMRLDYGEVTHKLYNEAFLGMTQS
jgi:hypothetical protein